MKDQVNQDLAALTRVTEQRLSSIDETAKRTLRARKGSKMNKTTNWMVRVAAPVATLLVGGAVFAAANHDLFWVSVDTTAKSEAEVEHEVRDQLKEEGFEETGVRFEREEDRSTLTVEGQRGQKKFIVIHETDGDEGKTIEMRPPALDLERTPGMTDDELRAKIEEQLQALGIDGTVVVTGRDDDEGIDEQTSDKLRRLGIKIEVDDERAE